MTATHRLGVLSVDGVAELQQSLELVVPGEGDDLQDGAKLTEDLIPTQKQTNKNRNKQTDKQPVQLQRSGLPTCCRTSRVTG